MQHLQSVPIKLWLLLAAGSMLFFLFFTVLSIAFGLTGTQADQIAPRVSSYVPHAVLFVVACLGAVLLGMQSEVLRAWRLPDRSVIVGDLAIGAACGLVLAGVYLLWLSPVVEWLQRTIGDFVPPGAVLPALAGNMGVFFVANVLLAPVVEETIYRGIALPVLGERYGVPVALVLSCAAFGLLHWAGGIWYMLLTGMVAGGCFAALYYLRGGILAPVAAHLALNLVEFIYVARKVA